MSIRPVKRIATSTPAIEGAGVKLQIPVHRGQSFRRIADSVPVIADSC